MTINALRTDSVAVVSIKTEVNRKNRIYFDALPEGEVRGIAFKYHLSKCDKFNNKLALFTPFREKWKPLQILHDDETLTIQTIYINTYSAKKRLSWYENGKYIPFETKWLASGGSPFFGTFNAKLVNDQIKKMTTKPLYFHAKHYKVVRSQIMELFRRKLQLMQRPTTEAEKIQLLNAAKVEFMASKPLQHTSQL